MCEKFEDDIGYVLCIGLAGCVNPPDQISIYNYLNYKFSVQALGIYLSITFAMYIIYVYTITRSLKKRLFIYIRVVLLCFCCLINYLNRGTNTE